MNCASNLFLFSTIVSFLSLNSLVISLENAKQKSYNYNISKDSSKTQLNVKLSTLHLYYVFISLTKDYANLISVSLNVLTMENIIYNYIFTKTHPWINLCPYITEKNRVGKYPHLVCLNICMQ